MVAIEDKLKRSNQVTEKGTFYVGREQEKPEQHAPSKNQVTPSTYRKKFDEAYFSGLKEFQDQEVIHADPDRALQKGAKGANGVPILNAKFGMEIILPGGHVLKKEVNGMTGKEATNFTKIPMVPSPRGARTRKDYDLAR